MEKFPWSPPEREKNPDEQFIDNLNRKLETINPTQVAMHGRQSHQEYQLMKAYLYTDETIRGRTRVVKPKKKEDIRCIRLQFTPDTEDYFGESEYIGRQYIEGSHFQEYRAILKQIQAVRDQPYDKEKMGRLKILELRRREIESKAKNAIQKKANGNSFNGQIEIDEPSAGKIFTVLNQLWNIPQKGCEINFTDDIEGIDIETLTQDILEQTNEPVDIKYFMVEDDGDTPYPLYTLHFLRPVIPKTIQRVREVVKAYTLHDDKFGPSAKF